MKGRRRNPDGERAPRRAICPFGVALILASASALAAQQAPWNQWRGPSRDGTASLFPAPDDWTKGMSRRWSVPVGAGLSAPVTDGERVLLFTREGADEVLAAFALADGARLWEFRDTVPFEANMQAANPQFFGRSKGKGPFAAPLIEGGTVFTLGVTRLLQARSVENGQTIWSETLSVDFEGEGSDTQARWNAPNYYGAASSPLIHDGTLILQVGNSERGEIVGLDPATGERRWTWDGLAVVSSSPVIAELSGAEQLVAVTRYAAVGLAPKTGNELWRFELGSNAHIATPVIFEDTVIVGTYQGDQLAVDVSRADKGGGDAEGWRATERWRSDRRSFVATPVLRGGRLYGLAYNRRGQYYVLDADSGDLLWGSEGREGPHASFIDLGHEILVLEAFGALLVTEPGDPGLEVVARYLLTERQTWVHPAVVGADLLIRDTHELSRWGFDASGEVTVAHQPED